jgi:translation initiation factor 2A
MESKEPINQISFFSEKSGVSCKWGPPVSDTKLSDGEKGKFFIYSDNGRYLLILETGRVRIISTDTFEDLCVLPIAGVTHAYFSPLSSFVVTWQRPDKELTEENLKIWTIDGKLIVGWKQKHQLSWPTIQWSQDELISGALLQIGKVSFFAGANFSSPVQNISVGGISMFSISTGKSPYKVAVVIPEKGSNPGIVNIYNYPKVDKPSTIKTFKGDSVEIAWNSLGSAVLLTVNQDIDRTGKSYYGKKGLWLIQTNSNFESRVTADSIHDVKWNPNGKEFAVVYGNMPDTKITIFDLKCQKVADLGETGEARNTLYYDPKGRILCVGGFGSLNGNMDFWDISSDNIVKISSTNAFSASYHEWCPDSYHFLTGVVAPRMRQDNGVKIFNYNGELIYKEDIPELFTCHWRPQSPESYPATTALIAPNPKAQKIPPLAAPKPYRHPHFSGASTHTTEGPKTGPTRYTPGGQPIRSMPGGTPVGGELEDSPNEGAGRGRGGGQKKKKKPTGNVPLGSFIPGGQPEQPPQPHKPQKPPHQQQNKPAPKPQQPHQQQPKKPPQQQPISQNAPETVGTEKPTKESNANLTDNEKRRRTIIKKIREIDILKQRQQGGEVLNAAQIAKIGTEAQLTAELESIKNKPETKTESSI